MKLSIEFKDCRDCPMRRSHREMGGSWEYCNHQDSPGGYESILWYAREEFKEIPRWCPIMDSDDRREDEACKQA
jgi:hypothetical protein